MKAKISSREVGGTKCSATENDWTFLEERFCRVVGGQCSSAGSGSGLLHAFLFSPLLIIAVAIAGLIFGREAAQGHVVAQIEGLVGHDGATAVQAMIESARKPASGILASLFGLFTLLVGATGLFGELQGALNTIWDVPDQPGNGFIGILRIAFCHLPWSSG